MQTKASLVNPLRVSSRELVRQLGFMGGPFAGTDLSPSAVHALIEIEASPGMTARRLGELLHLEKSSVSRMLRKLVESDVVAEQLDESDTRTKKLVLTKAGAKQTAAIHAFANDQVAQALGSLTSEEALAAVEGVRLYAKALAQRDGAARITPVTISNGYRPGLIARITEMHAAYYSRSTGFGQRFESLVAGGLADFCNRLENPKSEIWSALQGEKVVGSIAIDGEDLGGQMAHLRWFIVDDGVRGGGVGRSLLSTALAFADTKDFKETHLSTVSGLAAARRLYEAHGFVCVDERAGEQWGKKVLEQRFVRLRA